MSSLVGVDWQCVQAMYAWRKAKAVFEKRRHDPEHMDDANRPLRIGPFENRPLQIGPFESAHFESPPLMVSSTRSGTTLSRAIPSTASG
jgi:hypothetical protein